MGDGRLSEAAPRSKRRGVKRVSKWPAPTPGLPGVGAADSKAVPATKSRFSPSPGSVSGKIIPPSARPSPGAAGRAGRPEGGPPVAGRLTTGRGRSRRGQSAGKAVIEGAALIGPLENPPRAEPLGDNRPAATWPTLFRIGPRQAPGVNSEPTKLANKLSRQTHVALAIRFER